MADSDNESYDSSSPRSSSYDDWTKEPLVGEKLCVYLLHWDKATQDLPDIFDTTLIKPKDPTTIYRCVSECVIHYHSTTLTRAQFELEYGMPPRSRDEEIMRLRHAMLAQYLTEVEMDRKKRHALNQDDMHEVDETAALRTADMSPLDRLKYVTSLWPTNMPNFPDTEDSLNYYGFQVGIYIDTNDETKDETNPASTHNQDETTKAADPNENDHDTIDTPLDDAHQPEANSSKQPLMKAAPAAPVKEENWVQCDKCQKWRKLPDSVDVSALPTTWYCRMNKWSRKFNKCSAVEETTTAPAASHGGSDMHSIRERKFVHQFAQRLKRMEKALGELKYADMKEDLGGRQHVSCVECGKKRPLLGGMDPIKVPQPFVCWMNRWDEIHASCSAPQGVLFERGTTDTPAATAAAAASGGAAAVDKKSLKQPRRTSHARSNHRSTKPKKKAATAEPLDVAAPPPPLYSSTSEEEIAPKKPRRDDMASTTRKK